MHVRVRLDGAEPRRWQIALLERIAATPGIRAVSIDAAQVPNGWPDTVELLFRLEALIHRLPRIGSERLPPTALDRWRRQDAWPDLTIDLCGDLPAGP
ncbi:MAG: formyl transferase, partial [Methylobacterium sp.]